MTANHRPELVSFESSFDQNEQHAIAGVVGTIQSSASAASRQVDALPWRLRGSESVRVLKTIGFAILLTLLFMSFQLLTHLPTGLIAPISAGLTTGGVMRVTPRIAFLVGLVLFILISGPAPLAYLYFGFANHLPFVAIAVFSTVFGAYYGTLIGVFSWIGGKMKPWEPLR